ncbi:winged helix-turn-helix domain-containing protein [Priestia megaterium]
MQKGTIPPHEKLPSKRKLALHLSISQNTVEAAYIQLEAEGYIEILARKGTFVKEIKMKSCFKNCLLSLYLCNKKIKNQLPLILAMER